MNIKEITRATFNESNQPLMHITLAEVLELSSMEDELITNIGLFKFARGIRALGLARNEEFSMAQLREMFSQWYSSNDVYHHGEGGFDDMFFDFLEKLKRVKVPLGQDFVEAAWQTACVAPYPPEAKQFQQDELKQLTALCWQMQLAAEDGVFYLSCRQVQALMKLNAPEQAARWLRGLVRIGVLEEVEKGGPHTNKATRYRYISLGH
jgi:hypothetical protein